MTVYYLDRQYETDIRIEVDDDVQVHCNTYKREAGMAVTFSQQTSQYETNHIAAFDGVQTLRKEGVDVQYKEWKDDDKAESKTEDKPVKQIWVNAQEKS